jgi:hypothetical protein
VTESAPPGLLAMLGAGLRALRRHARTALALYALQAACALLFFVVVAQALAAVHARHPLLDRGVGGDLAALGLALRGQVGAISALAWAGVALAAAYGLLSLYLTAGLLGALADRGFGATAIARFGAFVRLWLWSLLPYGVALIVLGVGLGLTGGPDLGALTVAGLLAPVLRGALPGLLALVVTSVAVDYARAILVAGEAPRSAGLALLRGVAAAMRPAPILHLLGYLATWTAITGAYLAFSFQHPIRSALAIFVLRQLVSAARFTSKVVLLGGQLERVRARRDRSG